jgi:hypothetical protein
VSSSSGARDFLAFGIVTVDVPTETRGAVVVMGVGIFDMMDRFCLELAW